MAATVYIDTSVFSVRFSEREDVGSVYRRQMTEDWWAGESHRFMLRTSLAVIDELSAGAYLGQAEAIELARSVPLVGATEEAQRVAEVYMDHRLMPRGALGDALHLALAAVNELDYLMTWNIKHLANAKKMNHMMVINRRMGLISPAIVTPEMLWHEDTP